MDPDPAIFVIDLQDASKKLIFNTIFPAYYSLKVHLHHFSKIKIQKESQNRSNQVFSYYFCMMIEGSGSESIPLTSGSGSGRPKNMWIRIRNTDFKKACRETQDIPYFTSVNAPLSVSYYCRLTVPNKTKRCLHYTVQYLFVTANNRYEVRPRSSREHNTSVVDPGCLSQIRLFSILDPESASKNLSILTKKMVSKLWEIWPDCSSRIPDPDPYFSPIPDPGVKKSLDPGSGSATLHNTYRYRYCLCGSGYCF
jgi:hypothetical protein